MSKIRWVGFAINRSVDSEAAGPTVCDPTGALVASPTMGLPETVGGERNWDYRYTWMRDAAFTLYALIRVGFEEEAHRFMGWLRERRHDAWKRRGSPLRRCSSTPTTSGSTPRR